MNADTGTLAEHQAPEKDDRSSSNKPDYQPSPDERKIIKFVDEKFEKAKKFRSQYDSKWLDWYKMFRGKQWREQRPSYRHSEVLNLIFQNIQSQVPIITDTRPKFEFLPQEPSDYPLSEVLNELAQADWVKHNWMYQLTEVLYDGHMYGTGMSCLKYDPKKMRMVYESADPFYCFPDPVARDVNYDSDYFCYAEPMSLKQIRDKWPEKGKFVKPDLVDLLNGTKSDLAPMRYQSPTDQRMVFESQGTPDLYQPKDMALVKTLYCKSDEMEETEATMSDPDTGEQVTQYMKKLRYPNGKKIVIANKIVLEMGPNPYEHGEFPYQRWQNYILPREFWGMSEIEQLEGPQKTFNKIVSFAMDCLTLMGNPIWVVDNTADVDTDNLVSRPGSVIEKSPGSEVRRVEGTQLQPYVLQLIDRYKEWFDQIGGSNDVTRGLNPSGVTAASAIADLQNAAQTRIRQKSRNLDCYLQQLGQQYLALVFQYYTAPMVYRVTNKEGMEKYFKFHVDPENNTVNVENYSDDGKSLGISSYQLQGKFDVRVSTGSSLPFSKAEKEQRLLNLFDRQIIDQTEVLKGLDYPNYEALIKRMQDMQAQQAEAAAQQGGGKVAA